MQANKDTNELIKIALNNAIDANNKEQIKDKLLETAVSEWRLKGQAKGFLLNEFNRLQPKGWTKKEFEEIYEQASIRKKGRKPKQPLFEGGV
jgi:BioD-like phosphotransacetylase family protein